MLIDPREFRRIFPFLAFAAAALAVFLASTSRHEAATCLTVCACVTMGVRAAWGSLLGEAPAPLKALGFLVASGFGLAIVVAGYHAVNADAWAATLAAALALVLRGMLPTPFRERGAA